MKKKESTAPRIFGTDGVRGYANEFPMTVEVALALGRAAGKMFLNGERKHRVVIGKDTRLSCYMIENALIAGLCSMGIDTLMVGPLPTPAVAFITRAYRANAGVVISASHNPYHDNGIKFFSEDGYKFSDEWEAEMERLVHEQDFSDALPEPDRIGRNYKVIDAHGRYIEFVKATFPKGMSLHGMKVVLDCANGAGYRVAPLIFQELDAETFVYGTEPNGLNINLDCGALHPGTAQKGVIDHHAHVGIAIDGDGDRVIMIDENAQIIDGDAILAICANDLLQSGKLRNQRVVTTVMANLGFIHAMQERGIEVVTSAVGDRNVIHAMREYDSNLGGEQSGHLIFSDYNTTGDGLVAALQVLRIMQETGMKLSTLASIVKKYPQTCMNVRVSSKPPMSELKHVKSAIRQAEKTLETNGRVLVRYSGTENVCRVMVEGIDEKLIVDLAKNIADAIQEEIGTGKRG